MPPIVLCDIELTRRIGRHLRDHSRKSSQLSPTTIPYPPPLSTVTYCELRMASVTSNHNKYILNR